MFIQHRSRDHLAAPLPLYKDPTTPESLPHSWQTYRVPASIRSRLQNSKTEPRLPKNTNQNTINNQTEMSTIPILFSFPSAASSEQRGISTTTTATSALAESTASNFVTVTITTLSSHTLSTSSSTPTSTISAALNSTSNSTTAATAYKDNKFSGADWATTIILGLGGIVLCCMIPIVVAVYWKDWQAKRRERWEDSSEDF